MEKGLAMEVEKRLFKRYPMPDDALYVFCKDSSIKGWVTDISSGGMGFGYFSVENCRLETEVKLILAGDKVNVYIPDIKCRTIYDQSVNNSSERAPVSAARRCGVQFGKLSAKMRKKLEEILEGQQFL